MESTPKNIRLECLFDRQATRNGAASLWKMDDGMVIRMCKSCLLMGPMYGSEKLEKGRLLQYRNIPIMHVSTPEAFLPGTLLDSSKVWLDAGEVKDGMLFVRVPQGVWDSPRLLALAGGGGRMEIVAGHGIDATALLANLPTKLFALPEEIGKDVGDARDMRPCITVTRTTGMPVLMLYGETSVLYTTLVMCMPEDPAHTVVVDKQGAYVFDGWSDKECAWKKLIKERKVKNMKANNIARPALSNVSPAVTQATRENTTPEESAAVNAAVGLPTTVPLAAIPLAAVPAAPAQEEEEALAEEEAQAAVQQMKEELTGKPKPAEEPVPEAVAEPPKAEDRPRVKRAAKPVRAVGMDLGKVIETISADVDDITSDQFDAALNEIRALRDLQIAAARRMTNLCTAMCKFSQGAIDKYNKVLNALK